MYFLLEKVDFHCYVTLPEGNIGWNNPLQAGECPTAHGIRGRALQEEAAIQMRLQVTFFDVATFGWFIKENDLLSFFTICKEFGRWTFMGKSGESSYVQGGSFCMVNAYCSLSHPPMTKAQ